MHKTIWINWESTCRRTKELCDYLGIVPDLIRAGRPKLFSLIYLTVKLIYKQKPGLVIVSSLRVALLAIVLRPIFRYSLVLDAHYSGIIPRSDRLFIVKSLYNFIHQHANLVLVTNVSHSEIVRRKGGNSLVLQDRIPSPPESISSPPAFGLKKIVCICSYSHDEPIEQILEAARKLINENICFYFTGNSSGRIDNKNLPHNVNMTGYLPEFEYWQLLHNANIIIDLTTRDDCLVCGAYEAAALCKPMILSSTKALRSYFTRGVIFTENFSDDIANKVRIALMSEKNLLLQVKELKQELEEKWEPVGVKFKSILYDSSCFKKIVVKQKRLGASHG